MFSSAADTINKFEKVASVSAASNSTNKCYGYPGPFKNERKWAQDLLSELVKKWIIVI